MSLKPGQGFVNHDKDVGGIGNTASNPLNDTSYTNTTSLLTTGTNSLIVGVAGAANNQNTTFTFTSPAGSSAGWTANNTANPPYVSGDQFDYPATSATTYSLATSVQNSGENFPGFTVDLLELTASCSTPTPVFSPTVTPTFTDSPFETPTPTFTAAPADCIDWSLNESAVADASGTQPGKIILTNNNLPGFGSPESGEAWSPSASENLATTSFSDTYKVFFGNNTAGTAGMAFVLQQYGSSFSTTATGPGLGFSGRIPGDSLEIGISTENSGGTAIPGTVTLYSDANMGTALAGPVNALPGDATLKDGKEHTLTVAWNAVTDTLSVYLDGNLDVSYTNNIVSNIFGGNGNVYWGFTASTDNTGNLQYFYDPNCSITESVCTTGWVTNGSAAFVAPTQIMMTPPNTNWLTAAAWSPDCLNVGSNFDLTYKVYLGTEPQGSGADGMTFTLQDAGTNILGSVGGELGIQGISPSVSVEIDTYDDGGPDPAYDHIAVDVDGSDLHNGSNTSPAWAAGDGNVTSWGAGANNGTAIQASTSETDVKDGALHTFELQWNAAAKTLTVLFDGQMRLVYTNDIVANLFGGTSCLTYGFTAATGGFTDEQYFIDENCLATPTSTDTLSVTRTDTPSVTRTDTPSVTRTDSPTATPTDSPTATPTNSPTATPTKTDTASPTDTFTATPTDTITASPTPTITVSPTKTVTVSATDTPTVSPTDTFTASPTDTVTASPTRTITVSPTKTFTPSPTDTFTASPTESSTPSPTDTFTASPTFTKLPTGSATDTYTFTVSPTNTFTASPIKTQTPSPTDTPSSTPTDTVTASPTDSFTPSPSDTFTASPTFTKLPTGSVTDTFTLSVSPTGTFSPTATRTLTASPTESPTSTPTDTFTASPTLTSTASPTKTFTDSPTFTEQSTGSVTDTFTLTASPTASVTPSATNTSTPSPTPTPSLSPSDTPTPGASPSDTFSASPTPTLTPSPTDSFTASPVDSPTDSPTSSATDTASPSFTDSPTQSATKSATRTSTASATATDSPQNTVTDTRTASPSVTASPSSSVTKTVTWTATDTPSVTASPSQTPSLSATQSATVTQTFTESATPVPEPYMVTVDIYNSAGELVRSLYNGTSENSAGQAQVLETVTRNGATQVDITGLDGNAGTDLVWGATNNGGQSVQSGVYTVQITSKNTFGQIQTQTMAVSVAAVGGPATLNIFNSAGELVANLSGALAGDTSAPIGMSLVLPGGQSAVLASANAALPGSTEGVTIKLAFADGSTQTVFWNGLSPQGQPLQPGNYLATLGISEPGAGKVVQTKPFVLLSLADSSAASMAQSALVLPDPVDSGWFMVQYQPSGSYTAVAALYNLAGQLVARGVSEGPGAMRVSGDWSGGIYLLDFEVRDASGMLARRVLKVAIVR